MTEAASNFLDRLTSDNRIGSARLVVDGFPVNLIVAKDGMNFSISWLANSSLDLENIPQRLKTYLTDRSETHSTLEIPREFIETDPDITYNGK